jgi:hypothetical protein
MTMTTQADDDGFLRKARRLLADIGSRIGPIDGAAARDPRGIAVMIAELDAELAALRARRDELGREIAMAAFRMNAAAVYAKSRTAGQNGAHCARRRISIGAGS